MFRPGRFRIYFQPVPDHGSVSERDPVLDHAPRSGVHAQQKKVHFRSAIPQIFLESFPGIVERIIDMEYRCGKLKDAYLIGQIAVYFAQISLQLSV
jgi:hypothetical protein